MAPVPPKKAEDLGTVEARWTTVDGGGYCGGDSQSPAYRETQLRWMQVSATLPIMRQHGQRDQ